METVTTITSGQLNVPRRKDGLTEEIFGQTWQDTMIQGSLHWIETINHQYIEVNTNSMLVFIIGG